MNTEKSMSAILAETKEELKEFFDTRYQLLKTELTEKMQAWKTAIPLLVIGGVLALTAWVVLTFALVALVHTWFLPSTYAWVWGALIVGFLYLLIGGIVGWLGYGEISQAGMAPTRTINVLKQDQVWIQNEARTA